MPIGVSSVVLIVRVVLFSVVWVVVVEMPATLPLLNAIGVLFAIFSVVSVYVTVPAVSVVSVPVCVSSPANVDSPSGPSQMYLNVFIAILLMAGLLMVATKVWVPACGTPLLKLFTVLVIKSYVPLILTQPAVAVPLPLPIAFAVLAAFPPAIAVIVPPLMVICVLAFPPILPPPPIPAPALVAVPPPVAITVPPLMVMVPP
jgi:hypothetical protein